MLLPQISVLFVGFLTVFCDDPIVVISETDPPKNKVYNQVVAEKDRDVQLTCIVENKPELSEVKWEAKLGNSSFVITSSTAVKSDTFKYSLDQPSPTAWRLRIQNVQVTDEGRYTCAVQVGSQNYDGDSEQVRVVETPQIADLQTSSDTIVKQGDSVNFRCNATGRPFPMVRWSRLAGELLPSGGQELRSYHLNINQVQPEAAGIYKCTADNEAGHDERKIKLVVKHHPLVKAESERVRQAIGYIKSLVCNVQAYPEPGVSWSRDLAPLESIKHINIRTIPGALNKLTSILTIYGVHRDDYGEYRCSAVNTQGEGSDSIILEQSQSPTPDRTGNEMPSSASFLAISFMTIIMVLSTCLLQN